MSDGEGKKLSWLWGSIASAFATLVFLAISVVLNVQTSATKDQIDTVYQNIEATVATNTEKNSEQDTRFGRIEKDVTANTTNIASLTRSVDRLTDRIERMSMKQ